MGNYFSKTSEFNQLLLIILNFKIKEENIIFKEDKKIIPLLVPYHNKNIRKNVLELHKDIDKNKHQCNINWLLNILKHLTILFFSKRVLISNKSIWFYKILKIYKKCWNKENYRAEEDWFNLKLIKLNGKVDKNIKHKIQHNVKYKNVIY